MRLLRLVLLALPGVVLGVAGWTHPRGLSYPTSEHWWQMHAAALFVFPLIGVALMWLARGHARDPISWVLVPAAFVYACAYTALDVISGIAAGWVTYRLGPGVITPDEVEYLFEIGGRFGQIGGWALVVAAVAATLSGLRHGGLRSLPGGALVVLGAWGVMDHHIYAPYGALGCIGLGLGTAWIAAATDRRTRRARSRDIATA